MVRYGLLLRCHLVLPKESSWGRCRALDRGRSVFTFSHWLVIIEPLMRPQDALIVNHCSRYIFISLFYV